MNHGIWEILDPNFRPPPPGTDAHKLFKHQSTFLYNVFQLIMDGSRKSEGLNKQMKTPLTKIHETITEPVEIHTTQSKKSVNTNNPTPNKRVGFKNNNHQQGKRILINNLEESISHTQEGILVNTLEESLIPKDSNMTIDNEKDLLDLEWDSMYDDTGSIKDKSHDYSRSIVPYDVSRRFGQMNLDRSADVRTIMSSSDTRDFIPSPELINEDLLWNNPSPITVNTGSVSSTDDTILMGTPNIKPIFASSSSDKSNDDVRAMNKSMREISTSIDNVMDSYAMLGKSVQSESTSGEVSPISGIDDRKPSPDKDSSSKKGAQKSMNKEELCDIIQQTVDHNQKLKRKPYMLKKRASLPNRIKKYTTRLVPGGRALAKSTRSLESKLNRTVSMTKLKYLVTKMEHRSKKGALIDRGANGGVAGQDVRVIAKSDRSVNITGIDNHEMKNIPIGTIGAVVMSQRGKVIAVMHQYAIAGKGRTIHSCAQLEHYENKVDDKSIKVGGKQLITTLDG